MESRYHYFPGQNARNTNVSDRKCALHITKDAWNDILIKLERKRQAKEAVEREERHHQYLYEESRNMIKNWSNSLENIRKRKAEERVRLLEEEKEMRRQKFIALQKEQEKMRKIFVEKAQRANFMNHGNARQLTSAYIEGEILHEREKQLEFNNVIRQYEQEEQEKEEQRLKRITQEYEEDTKAERERNRQKKKECGDYFRSLFQEKERRAKEEAERKRIKNEEEYRNALDEIECMKRIDVERKISSQRAAKRDVECLILKAREAERLAKIEDKELDECAQVFQNAKEKMNCLRKQREKEIREEIIAQREKLAQQVCKEKPDEEAIAERLHQKAVAEKEALALERLQENEEARQKQIQDRLQIQKEFLEKREESLRNEKEIKKWELLNRFKTDEAVKNYEADKKRKLYEKKYEYGNDVLKQACQTKGADQREKEMDEYIAKAIQINDDEHFFAYADELLEKSKKKGKPTRRIELVIQDYKETNYLPVPGKPAKDDPALCEDYTAGMKLYTRKNITQPQITEKKRKCKCLQ